MKLICYALHDFAPKLIAAPSQRQWMDDFPDRHAYRCLPLSIANAHGWEVLCPAPIEIEWNGGPAAADLEVRALRPLPCTRLLCAPGQDDVILVCPNTTSNPTNAFHRVHRNS